MTHAFSRVASPYIVQIAPFLVEAVGRTSVSRVYEWPRPPVADTREMGKTPQTPPILKVTREFPLLEFDIHSRYLAG